MIELKNVSLQNGEFKLSALSFEIPRGTYSVLMGRSGSGKTTILECICGLKPVTAGAIVLDGKNANALKPAQRGVGYVPQDGALFNHMTVRQHLEYALILRRWSSAQRTQRVDGLAQVLGLECLLDRFPLQLSGGEKQRVAIGRAISFRPAILCLDEPLSALDDQTREEMFALLHSVKQTEGLTAIHVTHRESEAKRLADLRLEISEGRVNYARKAGSVGIAAK